ncbi:MAG TPA: hypothetical protein DEP84_24875, partial [Chloroflexi bacterium]|nr:hypothetical protein [Chloroflexota bacterium]
MRRNTGGWIENRMLDWRIEEHDDFPAGTERDTPDVRTSGWHPLWRHLVLVTLLLLVVGAGWLGGRLWRAQVAMRRDLDAVLRTEVAAGRAGDRDLYATTLDPALDADIRAAWTESLMARVPTVSLQLERATDPVLDAGLVRAEVLVAVTLPDGEGVSTRQPRFYRSGPDGLQRTQPGARFWGLPQHRLTRFFEITYRAPDRDSVAALAHDLDDRYAATYRHLLGQPPTEGAPRLLLQVLPADALTPAQRARSPLVVASPSLAPRPTSLTPREWLRSQVATQVVVMLISRASKVPPPGSGWGVLVEGVRAWEVDQWLDRRTPETTSEAAILRDALSSGRLLPLWQIESPLFIVDPALARLARAEGYSLAAY